MSETWNIKSLHGEPGTGYEGPGKGRFNCVNCKYFDAVVDGCDQPDMKEKSTRPRLPSGKVEVDPKGCCDYIERKG